MERLQEADALRRAPDTADATDRADRADRGDHGDAGADPDRSVVLADPARRVAEHRMYRALVDHVYGKARDAWAEAVPQLRASWEVIKEKYGHEERDEPTPPADGGSWRGKGGRTLDAPANAAIDRGYVRICEVGESDIVPRILQVAAEDPSRTLAGFDRHIKGADRLKEKVADLLEPPSTLTAAEALNAVIDVVRFTFTYREVNYAQGVLTDVERLKAEGFVLDKLKNTWPSDQYKGINAQWLEPNSGVRFEVQFHTQASLEAKELTHKAYERFRSITVETPETERETAELEAFQGRANGFVPIPPDVSVIEDYRREKRDG
jgi:hypothetical protein